VQVYAVSVYVEAEKAARELGVRQRGGFFDDNRDEDYALALVDGAFAKALVVRLVRKVEGKQFYEVGCALPPCGLDLSFGRLFLWARNFYLEGG
jgi:hypothetical protein